MPTWLKTIVLMSLTISLCLAAAVPAAAQDADDQPPAAPIIDLPGVTQETLHGFQPARGELDKDGERTGYVDWSRKVVVAVGRTEQRGTSGGDALMAQRGAEMTALRNSLAAVAGVPIGASGRVDALRDGRIDLQGFVKDFKITRTYSRQAGDVTYWYAEVEIPLFGVKSLAGRLYDSELAAQKVLTRGAPRARWADGDDPQADSGDVLVIDARGLGFKPSVFPVVMDAAGQVVLDMQTCEKKLAVERGPCAYGTTELKLDELRGRSALPAWSRNALAAGSGMNVDGVEWWKLALAQADAPSEPAGEASPAEAGEATSAPSSQPAGDAASQPQAQTAPAARRFVYRAAATQDKNKAVLVIADEDSMKMLADPHVAGLAKSGKVLVVVDAAAAGLEGRAPLGEARPQLAAAIAQE